jgi:uncharacterized protein (TIGR03083 family)
VSISVGVDRAKVARAIETLSGRIADMIRDLPDTSTRIPGADWTVGEVGAHLSDAQRLFSRLAAGETVVHGDGTPGSLAHANEQLLVANPQREASALASSIVDNTANFLRSASGLAPSRTFDTPMGRMDTDTMYAYMLTHLMMHGFQLERALHRRLGLERATVHLALPFIKHSMPMIVDTQAGGKLRAVYEVRIRGGSRFWVKLDHGVATVHNEKPGRVDCFISADPVSLLLVGLKLESQWAKIAQGKLLAWGRKPWLGFRFAGLFIPP